MGIKRNVKGLVETLSARMNSFTSPHLIVNEKPRAFMPKSAWAKLMRSSPAQNIMLEPNVDRLGWIRQAG